MKYIVDMPEWWSCCKNGELNCEWCDTEYGCPKDCALATAKKAVEVRFEIDEDSGLAVVDENDVFHFEGQDKYYAVEDK